MDQASVRKALRYNSIILLGILAGACGQNVTEQKPVPISTPAPQFTPPPVEIKKPVNVSFSTYSKDWPVEWQWIDPDEAKDPTPHDVKGGVLRVTVETRKDLHGEYRNAPRYLKSIKGDFQIETRVRFSPKENYQGAGLLIFVNDNNYLRFERAYAGGEGGGEGIRLDIREGSDHRPIVTPGDIQWEAPEVDLKVMRIGRLFIAYWRANEEQEWREAGEYESQYPDAVLAGVAVVNTARPVTAEFVYIKLLPGVGR